MGGAAVVVSVRGGDGGGGKGGGDVKNVPLKFSSPTAHDVSLLNGFISVDATGAVHINGLAIRYVHSGKCTVSEVEVRSTFVWFAIYICPV